MKERRVIIAAAVIALLSSCDKQSVQSIYDRQETTISNFVEAQLKADPDATVTYNGGSVRITLHDTMYKGVEGADSLRAGGTVSFYYAGYTLSGTSLSSANMFATNWKEAAESAGWALSDESQFHIETLSLDDDLIEGLRNGLVGVQNQDECIILFSGKYGFGAKKKGTVPPRSALAFHVWVNSFDNE